MNRCVECDKLVYGKYICQECFQAKLRENPEIKQAANVDVSAPENKWF